MNRARRNAPAVAVVRTALIGYGALAISLLLARSGLQQAAVPVGLVAAGIALQLLLVFARRRAARQDAGGGNATAVVGVLELLGDGITVLLFAIGTLGAVIGAAAPL